MRVHWFQHVPFEGLGSIEPWMQKHEHRLTCTRLYAGDIPPAVEDYDWLIVMGGPMSIHDETQHPWLVAEKAAISQAIQQGRPILGICLGAQLIAHCLGADVGPNAEPEIGWFDVRLTQNAALSPFLAEFNDSFDAFHWHSDRFACPRRALRVALSDACDQQAFIYNERVVGLQFHLETTQESASALMAHCADELVDVPTVQSAEQMLADPMRFTRLNALMDALLGRMETVAQRVGRA